MKKIITILIILFSINCYAENCWHDAIKKENYENALIQCADSEIKSLEIKLSGIYKKLEKSHKNDKEYLKTIEASRQSWDKFRDAQIELIYPGDRYCASSTVSCRGIKEIKLTERYISFLEESFKVDKSLMPEDQDECASYVGEES